jgi:hypothetical protein
MATIPESAMPAPRLELRWKDQDKDKARETGYSVVCVYSLVLRLGDHDIRAEREDENGELLPNLKEATFELSRTFSDGLAAKRLREQFDEVDTPFRDGAHAQWDTKQLGNLPIYAVAAGRAMLCEERKVT